MEDLARFRVLIELIEILDEYAPVSSVTNARTYFHTSLSTSVTGNIRQFGDIGMKLLLKSGSCCIMYHFGLGSSAIMLRGC